MPFEPVNLLDRTLIKPTPELIAPVYIDDIEGILVTKNEIARQIDAMRVQISFIYLFYPEFVGPELVTVTVMNGAAPFSNDLLRPFTKDHQFAQHSVIMPSYEGITRTNNKIIHASYRADDIRGKRVLIIEDIADTRQGLANLVESLKPYDPASISIAVLFDKPSGKKTSAADAHIQYVGFTVPDYFYVGFGLDCNGYGRGLEHLCVLNSAAQQHLLALKQHSTETALADITADKKLKAPIDAGLDTIAESEKLLLKLALPPTEP